MSRILCVWFPTWPLQRLCPGRAELKGRPLVLYEIDSRGRLLVAFCSRAAAAEGVAPGMPLAEAKGLLQSRPGRLAPHFEPHQAAADRQALAQLADWCRQFSPLVGFDDAAAPEGLLLDIAGCEHIFGGEQKLAERLQSRLRRGGYAPRLAVADTLGAAWALARYAEKSLTIVPVGCHGELIRPLPVEALRLHAAMAARLQELDLRRIGQLQDLPRSTLPSRFGPEVLLRLDQALGHVPEAVHPVRPTEPLVARWSSEEPLDDRHSITFIVRELLQRILRPLAARGEGVLALECRLDCGGETVSFPVRLLSATASFRRLDELFQLQLEQLRLPGPVSSLQLTATHTALVESRQAELFESEERDARRELARLIERLSSRLGAEAVCRPQLVADAQPEHASRLVACLNRGGMPEDTEIETRPAPAQCRPLRLLERPVAIRVVSIFPEGPPLRFEWDRAFIVAHFWGPERIATGWWRSPHVQRDYYRVETEEGRRFWLFRETKTGDWHLHGMFD